MTSLFGVIGTVQGFGGGADADVARIAASTAGIAVSAVMILDDLPHELPALPHNPRRCACGRFSG